MADGVRLRPSSPPAPSRTMSFSRSTTSNERSGLTWTTIMWMELVPISMAAMRMKAGAQQVRDVLIYTCEFTTRSPAAERSDRRHPTMNSRKPRVTTLLLQRLSRALARHLPAAVAGDDRGVHQARVTSRRLRETVPVLATGLEGSKAGKARRKIRRLTRALGTVRELDVTLGLLDHLARSPHLSRTAVEDVRAHVIAERDSRRAEMLKRLDRVNIEKLSRRLASVGDALDKATEEPWRKALSAQLLERSRRLGKAMEEAGHIYAPEGLHQVRIAAKKLRYGLELAADSGTKQAAPHVRTIKRVAGHAREAARSAGAPVARRDGPVGAAARPDTVAHGARGAGPQHRGPVPPSARPVRRLPAGAPRGDGRGPQDDRAAARAPSAATSSAEDVACERVPGHSGRERVPGHSGRERVRDRPKLPARRTPKAGRVADRPAASGGR